MSYITRQVTTIASTNTNTNCGLGDVMSRPVIPNNATGTTLLASA